jgi:alpha-L-fucosidase
MLSLLAAWASGAAGEVMASKENAARKDARMKWWRDARLGMFIHWNVSSVPAGVYHGKHNRFVGEWLMHDEKIPVAEYRGYAARFNPTGFNADEWVQIAKQAGMKYIVFTAKHHDGFAMYRSRVTRWNIYDATPFRRDPLAELAQACRRHGLKMGMYYSHAQDWVHPGGRVPGGWWDKAQQGDFDEYLRKTSVPMLREMLTRYGKVDVIWWDAPWEMTPQRAALFQPLLALQPGIITNQMLGGEAPGDIAAREQDIPATGLPGVDWETCMTMNGSWGYKRFDNNWKDARTLIRNLVDIASKGGNYLLNVVPTAEGIIPEPSVVRLRQMGQWLKVNGEAIYATTASPLAAPAWGRYTARSDKDTTALYLHVFEWPANGKLAVSGVPNAVEAAYLLSDAGMVPLKTAMEGGALTVHLSAAAPDPVCSVVVLRVKGSVAPVAAGK